MHTRKGTEMADNTPRVFTTEINGKRVDRIAYTPRDVIKFQFDGWTEVDQAAAKKAVSAVERDVKAGERAAADAEKAAAKTTDTTAKK